jgi:phage host-nuclease inhibitor protein Gam
VEDLLKLLIKPEVLASAILTVLVIIRSIFQDSKIKSLFGVLSRKSKANTEAIQGQQNDLNSLKAELEKLRNDNRRLENNLLDQLEFYKAEIERIRAEHKAQIEALKNFYEGELARLREELKKYGRTGTGELTNGNN